MPNEFHKDLTLDDIHAVVSRVYADIAARDADSAFHSVAANVNKVVRVDSPLSYYTLGAVTPTWVEFTSTGLDEFTELSDTPSSYSGAALQGLRVNAGEDALEFVALFPGIFLALIDTPGDYSGEAFKVLRVNVGEDALEFSTAGQGDVVGTVPSVDNALARYDGVSGLLIQNSLAILTDAGILSGLTQLNLDNIRIDGNSIISTDTDGNLVLSPDNAGLIRLLAETVPSNNYELSIDATGGGIITDGRSGPNTGIEYKADYSPDFVARSLVDKAYADLRVVGPASATDNALARFDLTTGKLIQNSLAILTDAGALSGLTSLAIENAGAGANPVLSSNSDDKDLLLDGNFEIEIAEPVLVGVLLDAVNLDNVFNLYVAGDFAYMAAFGSDSLAIINISDPTTPVLTGSLLDATNLNGARNVHVAGNFAYVACADGDSLAIVDITDPTAPVFVGSLVDGADMNFPTAVYVVGNYAYIGASISHSLSIIDIRDPANPTLKGRLIDAVNMNRVSDVYVVGNFAYVSAEVGDSLAVVDVSDPTNPVLRDTLVDAVNLDSARGLFVVGNHAYVASFAADSLSVIDISDPDNIVLTGSVLSSAFLNGATGIFVSGNFAYVSGGDRITIVDVSDKTTPVIVESLQDVTNLGSVSGIHVAGKYIYAASRGTDCLTIVETGRIVDVPTAFIGSLGVSNLDVLGNAVVTNDLYVNGLNSGPGGIAWNGVPVSREPATASFLTVYELSDLPAPSGNIIDVSAFGRLQINMSLLDLGVNKLTSTTGTVITGLGSTITTITSSHDDGTIDVTNTLAIQEMTLANTGANTRSVRFNNAAGFLFATEMIIANNIELGGFANVNFVNLGVVGAINFTVDNPFGTIIGTSVGFIQGSAFSFFNFPEGIGLASLNLGNCNYFSFAGGFLIDVEDPADIGLGTLDNIANVGAGKLTRCTPVSSSNFASPGGTPQGIAVDVNDNLISIDSGSDQIFLHTGITSTITTTIAAPASAPQGCAWHKGDLYSSDSGTDLIYRHDGFSTTILATVAAPDGGVQDITFVGDNLVLSGFSTNMIYVMDGFSATILEQFAEPGSSITGITYDGVNLITNDDVTDLIYVHEGVSATVQYTFPTPNGGTAQGVAVSSSGFVASESTDDIMYVFDHLVTFDHSSNTWSLEDLSGTVESSDRGGSSFDNGNTYLPVTVVQNVFTDIDNSAGDADIFFSPFSQREKNRLSDEENGEITWSGTRTRARVMTGTVNVQRIGATDRQLELVVCLNGVVRTDSKASVFLTNTSPVTLTTLPLSITIGPTDTVKLQFRDLSSGNGEAFALAKMSIV